MEVPLGMQGATTQAGRQAKQGQASAAPNQPASLRACLSTPTGRHPLTPPPPHPPQMLNAAGYGRPGSGLLLDLVYNPGGVFLAPPQSKLEPVYKQVGGLAGLRGWVVARARRVLAAALLAVPLLCSARMPAGRQGTSRLTAHSIPSAHTHAHSCLPALLLAHICPHPACPAIQFRSLRSTLASPSTPCSASTTCPSSAGQTTWHGSESRAGRWLRLYCTALRWAAPGSAAATLASASSWVAVAGWLRAATARFGL